MDFTSTETYVIILTNSVIGLFLLMTVTAIYQWIRRQFKARVNCWFCNTNTWVPYLDRNQWTCSNCEQYNGFTADGDYNKELYAQYNPKYNQANVPRMAPVNVHQSRASVCSSSMGSGIRQQQHFCDGCNRNQELKVHQLSAFTPTAEKNYDDEVELYKEQLEELYRLCPSCERIVKRRLNQAKTLILGAKSKKSQIRLENSKPTQLELRQKLKKVFRLFLILTVILLVIQFFVKPHLIAQFWNGNQETKHDTTTMWSGLDRNMSYRLALGATVIVLLMKGSPMDMPDYSTIISLSCLHFLIGEGLLKGTDFLPVLIEESSDIFEWILRIVALLASGAMFVELLRWSPTEGLKLNNSFHRIDLDDDDRDEDTELERDLSSMDNSRSMSYLSSRDPVDVWSQNDEEPFMDSVSNFGGHHNKSSPNQSSRTFVSSKMTSLHSPSKLFPDDRFTNSINSMRIAATSSLNYHQSVIAANPFMKSMPLLATSTSSNLSKSNATLYGSTRSLLTPSRLGRVNSSNSQFTGAESVVGSGFWNNHYPNVFTANTQTNPFAKATPSIFTTNKSMACHSMNLGLNIEPFVPLTESRSSSQSSGFESRSSLHNTPFISNTERLAGEHKEKFEL